MVQQARHDANEKERQHMLGLFKRILSRNSAARPAPPVPEAALAAKPAPKAAATPAPAPRTPPMRVNVNTLPPPAPRPVAPLPSPDGSTNGSTHVQVALAAIAGSLPEALSHKVPATPDQFVSIPVESVLSQLAFGSVQLTAAELRACAPEHFSALAGLDDVRVSLPLSDVVPQLSPQQYARRPQKRIEIPADVASVFAAGGGGPSGLKPTLSQPAPQVRPSSTVTMTTPAQSAAPAAAPTSAVPKISMSPQALASLRAKVPMPSSPSPSVTPSPARPAGLTPQRPITMTPATPAPAPLPSTPMPRKPAHDFTKPTGHLLVPLAQVCTDWVREVRSQLSDVDVENSQIHVPLEILEPAMKSGKPLFSWEEVAAWIKPPLLSPPTRKVGEMPVGLPLKVIAPLFMALHRTGAQKKAAVDQTIPDLFGGNSNGSTNGNGAGLGHSAAPAATSFTPPAPAAPARSVTPTAPTPSVSRMAAAPAPVAAPEPVAPEPTAPAVPTAESAVSIESVIGGEGARFSAKEIVANTSRLPGAAGALLVMNDGLLVTSQTPANVKSETIAAFLPQMFGRMNQYTKELALGPLQQLTLGVAGGQWHVVKCETIYFAVLGRPGESLPLNLLAQIAAELSSQSN